MEEPLGLAPLVRGLGRGQDGGDAAGPVGGQVGVCGEEEVGPGCVVVVVVGGVEAEELDAAGEDCVSAFLLAAAVEFLLVAAGGVSRRGLGVVDVDHVVGVSVGAAVGLDGVVSEPGAVARLPLAAADHAELGPAPARHVVAAFLELDGGGAVEAALPALLLGDPDELLRRGVLGAVAARVPFVVAGGADFGLAALALAVLAAAAVGVDVGGFDPGAAAAGGAVEAVFGRVFLVFAVPLALETVVEELFHVFEVNAVLCAAGGRHVLWVRCGEGEDAAEAGVAHAVFAW